MGMGLVLDAAGAMTVRVGVRVGVRRHLARTMWVQVQHVGFGCSADAGGDEYRKGGDSTLPIWGETLAERDRSVLRSRPAYRRDKQDNTHPGDDRAGNHTEGLLGRRRGERSGYRDEQTQHKYKQTRRVHH